MGRKSQVEKIPKRVPIELRSTDNTGITMLTFLFAHYDNLSIDTLLKLGCQVSSDWSAAQEGSGADAAPRPFVEKD